MSQVASVTLSAGSHAAVRELWSSSTETSQRTGISFASSKCLRFPDELKIVKQQAANSRLRSGAREQVDGGRCTRSRFTGVQETTYKVNCRAGDLLEVALCTTPLVKICGITNVEDAVIAASAGADFIGMILWPKAKRSVSFDMAARISAAAGAHGAQTVGVFVDEDAETIVRACEAANVSFAQLHGDGARDSLVGLPASLKVTCVLHADKDGVIQTPLPAVTEGGGQIDWVLVDGMQGGSGEAFDWTNLKVPSGVSVHGWMLAGGLNPTNVAEAAQILQPQVVDVSSGVTGPDKLLKDREKVVAFIKAAKGLRSSLAAAIA
eukprot:jgi/Mesen1/492/ME001024S10719